MLVGAKDHAMGILSEQQQVDLRAFVKEYRSVGVWVEMTVFAMEVRKETY